MKNITDTGGSAFPCAGAEAVNPESLGITALDYFASHEVTQPPKNFMMRELGNGVAHTLGPKGQKIPTGPPSPEDIAAALAKWRYLCAEKMLDERQRRTL
jgi:hypothetical protein